MNLIPVNSSNVAAVGYDPQSREMHVRFKGKDRVYVHDGVTPEEHAHFIASSSKGSHYHANFRGKHRKD